jgi:hypothetical protein
LLHILALGAFVPPSPLLIIAFRAISLASTFVVFYLFFFWFGSEMATFMYQASTFLINNLLGFTLSCHT